MLTAPQDNRFVIQPERLAKALAWAEANYTHCTSCAQKCGVNRYTSTEGRCGLGEHGRIYKEYIHFGEEKRLLPSHTVYLTGCSFRCAFCSDWAQVVQPLAHGVEVSPKALAARILARKAEGAANVNFVGGVPDVNLLYLLRTLSHLPSDMHVVWNTNHWTTPEVIEQLEGIVGTWLSDLKFGNDRCAKKLAQVDDYLATIQPLLLQVPAERLLIRHLLMPGHFDCCTKPVLTWLSEHLPHATLNLMTGYSPFRLAGAKQSPLSHRIDTSERALALSLFADLPFRDRLLDGEEWQPSQLSSSCISPTSEST